MLWATASDFPVSLNGVVRLDPSTPADAVIDVADELVRRAGHRVHGERGRRRRRRPAGRGRGGRAAGAARQPADGAATPPVDGARRAEPGSTLVWVDRPPRSRPSPSWSTPPTSRSGRRPGPSGPSVVALDRVLEPAHRDRARPARRRAGGVRPAAAEPRHGRRVLRRHPRGGPGPGPRRARHRRRSPTGASSGARRSSASRPHRWASRSTGAWATATSTARPASSASRPPPPDRPEGGSPDTARRTR